MSGGRVSIRGGRAWGPLSPKIGIKSLATFRVKNAPSLNCSDASDVLPNLSSFISKACSGYGPVWTGLQTHSA